MTDMKEEAKECIIEPVDRAPDYSWAGWWPRRAQIAIDANISAQITHQVVNTERASSART
jgi:hypothetical protein